MTMESAPCGLENHTDFARSAVIDSDEIARSARSDNNAGMRCGPVTCTN